MKHTKKIHWIEAVLSNDEYASDQELITYFMQEGKMSEQEAKKWVAKRNFYLSNIVFCDGTVYDYRNRKDK